MNGPTPVDYWAAALCFIVAGVSLLALLVLGWWDDWRDRHYRPRLTRAQRRAYRRARRP